MLDKEDDLIDFPCSDTWLDFYHERGLTPRSSGKNREIARLERKLDNLTNAIEQQNKILQQLLDVLITKEMAKISNNQIYSKKTGKNLKKYL